MPPKFTETVKKGEIFRHEVAGAGGWGDPLERDPVAVAQDVRNEIVSRQRALEDYGVVLQGDKVDESATKLKRAEINGFVDGLNYLLYFEKNQILELEYG